MLSDDTKEIPWDRYKEVLNRHFADQLTLSLRGWEVALLHGTIRLAMKHPGINSMSPNSRLALKRWLDWCLNTMSNWGFTREELSWLDSVDMRPPSIWAVTHQHPPREKGFLLATAREILARTDAVAKYPSGIGKMDRGECPRGLTEASDCLVCHCGHLAECHYPMTCDEARCSHYDIERE